MAQTLYKFKADLKELDELNRKLGSAKAGLDALNKKNSLRMATNEVNTLNKSGRSLIGTFKSAGVAIAAAFTFRAIVGGMRGVVQVFSDFEARMAAVKAISGATDKDFKSLTKSALKLGSATVFTAEQVASLQEEYARLGFSTSEILAAQTATIDLAAATGENLSSSAQIAGSTLRAFGLDAEQTQRVVDVMGASFTNSALNLERFGQSMKFVAPVARSAGFTLEETSTLLMRLADNGLHGSIAGNALKNIFIKLGDANSTLNKHIGHSVQGLPQMIEVLKEMKGETFGLTEATALLDKRSAPAFLALLNNIEGLEGGLDTLNKAEGAVSRMAAIRLNTLEGDTLLLKSAFEGLGVTIGESFKDEMREAVYEFTKFIQGLQNGTGFISMLKGALSLLRAVVIGVTGRFVALKLASVSIGVGFSKTVRAVKVLTGNMWALARGTRTATKAFNGMKTAIASTGWGLFIVGLGYLADKLLFSSKAMGELERTTSRTTESINKDIDSIVRLNKSESERHDLLRKLNQDYPDLLANIDIETASNEQLLKVKNLINITEQERLNIAEKNQDIGEIFTKAAKEEGEILREIQELKEKGKDTQAEKERIKHLEWSIGKIKESAKVREDAILKEIEGEKKIIAYKKANSRALQELLIKDGQTTRDKYKEMYNQDLEDFRKLSLDKQGIKIEEVENELDFLKKLSKWSDLLYQANNAKSEAAIEGAGNAIQVFFKANQDIIGKLSESLAKEDMADVNIRISEMNKLVSNLRSSLEKGGEKSADPFKLNQTKNNLKKLNELLAKNVVDEHQRDLETAKTKFINKKIALDKENKLIKANIDSIASAKTIGESKERSQFLKSNRTKFETLKNLSKEEWDIKIAEAEKGGADYINLLNKLSNEEVEKKIVNDEILKQAKILNDKEVENLTEAHEARMRDIENRTEQIRIDKAGNSYAAIFKLYKDKKALADKELKDEKKRIADSDMSPKEKNLANLEAEKKHGESLLEMHHQRVEAIKQIYSQLADAILSVFNNMSELKIQRIEEDSERELSDLELKKQREIELAGNNESTKKGIEDKYRLLKEAEEAKAAEKVRAVKKKQFKIDKANSIVMALINGYQAITKVSSQTGVAAIVAAPIMSALMAVQVAAIAAQKFVGAKGGVIPSNDKYAVGGVVQGASHAQGGVHFNVGGRQVELEGNEVVINKRSSEAFAPLLSDINSYNGWGVKFANGGVTPGSSAITNKLSSAVNVDELAVKLGQVINSKEVFVSEAVITSVQNSVNISEENTTIFG